MRASLVLASFVCLSACKKPAAPAPPTPGLVSLVATAELRGTTEPCGCNSDPLGDLARVAPLVHGGLWLDGGDLTYPVEPVSPSRKPQADLKAQAIADIYADAEVALGPSDQFGAVAPPRQACNVTETRPLAPPHVRLVQGLRVGVFGVSDPARVHATDPVAAARAALKKLTDDHAEIVVALFAMKREDARRVMKEVPGVDFGIVGLDVEEGMREAEPVNTGWLVSPSDQGRRVAQLQIARAGAPAGQHLELAAFEGPAGRALALARADRRIAELKKQLDVWVADKTADPAFVSARRDELTSTHADRTKLASAPLTPPAGPYFTYALVDIKRALPRDPDVAKRLRTLDHSIGLANVAAANDTPAPAPEDGKSTYVGEQQCVRCHKAAAAFWSGTHHANAWKTLVDVDKQYNYDCIGCHVTGWQAPGGSGLGSVEKQGLTNVQCEVCHGPGSKHVQEAGLDDPLTVHAPSDNLCRAQCHTAEHSDTFALDAYLRDILGKGHGEARRKALGDGPTGHALREAALANAK
ncbi:MAG: multiheme c-type cytochrome [Polyangia bacterium]